MLLDLNRFSFSVFLKEVRLLTALALPMLLAQVAQVGIGFVDTVMAGGAGKGRLGGGGFGQQRVCHGLYYLYGHYGGAEPDDCPALRRG